MKSFAFALLVAMFLCNTFTVSAWAKPCADDGSKQKMQMSDQKKNNGAAPCEDMDDMQDMKAERDNSDHCKGDCFCMHMTSAQTLAIGSDGLTHVPFPEKIRHAFVNDSIFDATYSPHKRPPRV